MCRQELATREHMLDHGQLGPSTPANITPAGSRRPSTNHPAMAVPSMMSVITPPPSATTATSPPISPGIAAGAHVPGPVPVPGTRSRLGSETKPRRPSLLQFGGAGMSDTLMMSSIKDGDGSGNDNGELSWSCCPNLFIGSLFILLLKLAILHPTQTHSQVRADISSDTLLQICRGR
jgi:dual specificity phosphatase 12